MKKSIIYPILFLVTIFASCSKEKENEPANTDKSAQVALTYEGKLSIGTIDYNNVKIKVTRKAANEVVIESVSGQAYPAFASLTFSNFLYLDVNKSYVSTSGSSRACTFSFLSNNDIEVSLVNNFQDAMFVFEGTSIK